MRRSTLALALALPLAACGTYPETVTPAAQQVAAAPETPEQAHERQCKALAWAQYSNGPGDMNAALARVNDTLQRCRLNMPPAAPAPAPVYVQQRPVTVTCTPTVMNSSNSPVRCTSN